MEPRAALKLLSSLINVHFLTVPPPPLSRLLLSDFIDVCVPHMACKCSKEVDLCIPPRMSTVRFCHKALLDRWPYNSALITMQFGALRGVLAVFALGAFTFVFVATPVAAAVPSLRSTKAIFEDVKVFKNLVYNKPAKDVNEASDRSANFGELVQEKADVAFVDDTDVAYVEPTSTDELFNLAYPTSFLQDLMKLGEDAKQYAEHLMNKVKAENEATVGYKLHRMRLALEQLVLDAGALRHELGASAHGVHGKSMEDVGKKLDSLMVELFEQLKVMFPPPDHAPGHLERKEKVDAALGKLEEALIHFGVQCGVSEESMRAHTTNIIRTIEDIAITTGDLMEQHPHLTDTVVAMVVFMIVPEELILRPILSVLGFGPSGPIRGSAAAWAQRVFFGAEVKAGSWFAHLQEAGMVSKIPERVKKGLWAGIIGVIGGANAIGHSFFCR